MVSPGKVMTSNRYSYDSCNCAKLCVNALIPINHLNRLDLKLSKQYSPSKQPRLMNKKQRQNFHFVAYFLLDNEWEFITDN